MRHARLVVGSSVIMAVVFLMSFQIAHAMINPIYGAMDKCENDGYKPMVWDQEKSQWVDGTDGAEVCKFNDGTLCELWSYVDGKCSPGKYQNLVTTEAAYRLPDLAIGWGGLNSGGYVDHNPTSKNILITPRESPYSDIFSDSKLFEKYFPFEWVEIKDAAYDLDGVSVCNYGYVKSNPAQLEYDGKIIYQIPSLDVGKCAPVSITVFHPITDATTTYRFYVSTTDNELSKQNNEYSFAISKRGFQYINQGYYANITSDFVLPFYITTDKRMLYLGQDQPKDLIAYPITNNPFTVLPEPSPVTTSYNDLDILKIKSIQGEGAALEKKKSDDVISELSAVKRKYSQGVENAKSDEIRSLINVCNKNKGEVLLWNILANNWGKSSGLYGDQTRICSFKDGTVCEVHDLYSGRCRSGLYKKFLFGTEAIAYKKGKLPDLEIFQNALDGDNGYLVNDFVMNNPTGKIFNVVHYRNTPDFINYSKFSTMESYLGVQLSAGLTSTPKYFLLSVTVDNRGKSQSKPASLRYNGEEIAKIPALKIGASDGWEYVVLAFIPLAEGDHEYILEVVMDGEELSKDNNTISFVVTNGMINSMITKPANVGGGSFYINKKAKIVSASVVMKNKATFPMLKQSKFKKYLGKLVVAKDDPSTVWYVNPADGRKYLLTVLDKQGKIFESWTKIPGQFDINKTPMAKKDYKILSIDAAVLKSIDSAGRICGADFPICP